MTLRLTQTFSLSRCFRWEVKDKYDAEITDLKKNGASVKWSVRQAMCFDMLNGCICVLCRQ